ncbi:hypothetical protein BCF11_1276 [Collimonas sp. PA-H2]|nr:hypothetical protein BCF11_1276 [Collimonas sp. PA-H2]
MAKPKRDCRMEKMAYYIINWKIHNKMEMFLQIGKTLA